MSRRRWARVTGPDGLGSANPCAATAVRRAASALSLRLLARMLTAASRTDVAEEPVPQSGRAGQPVPLDADPLLVEYRRHRVVVLARQVDVDLGDLAPGRQRQGQCVDLCPADDPCLVAHDIPQVATLSPASGGTPSADERLLETAHHRCSVSHIPILPGDYDISASRQRPHLGGQRLPGEPSHDDGVAARELLEAGLVLGKPPRDAVVAADDPGARPSPDQPDLHTATGALIPGCGS